MIKELTTTDSPVSIASPVTGMAADYLKHLRLSCHLNLLNADANLHRLGAVTSLSGLELRLLDLIEEYLVTPW